MQEERKRSGPEGRQLHPVLVCWEEDPGGSNTREHAYRTTLYLNNKYFLDGRDPNSFANVAWIFGQHDRGWTEHEG